MREKKRYFYLTEMNHSSLDEATATVNYSMHIGEKVPTLLFTSPLKNSYVTNV